ncbi:MAG: hypothetical protein K2X03_16900 [Bryobacteraceae bacterium]|nr:hypothetical protein [Bryobacteraceae bacterium]
MDEDLKSPELDQLFSEYRQALPDTDGSADFMPGLWKRIDAKNAFNRRFRLWTHGVLTAALGCCLAMGAFLFTQNAPYSDYLDVLEADTHVETDGGAFQPASYEPSQNPAASAEPWIVVEDE